MNPTGALAGCMFHAEQGRSATRMAVTGSAEKGRPIDPVACLCAKPLSTVPAIIDEKHRIDQKPDGHECREPDRDHHIEPIVIATHWSVVDHLMRVRRRLLPLPPCRRLVKHRLRKRRFTRWPVSAPAL
jgi:hypothetical protein